MEKIKVTVKNVSVYVDEATQSTSVNLQFAEQFKGFALDKATGNYIETDVDNINFHRSVLTAQLCAACDEIADYRATRATSFGQKEFGVILRNAVLTIERTKHKKGDVADYKDADGNDVVFTRDCYTSNVVGAHLTARAIEKLDKACDL